LRTPHSFRPTCGILCRIVLDEVSQIPLATNRQGLCRQIYRCEFGFFFSLPRPRFQQLSLLVTSPHNHTPHLVSSHTFILSPPRADVGAGVGPPPWVSAWTQASIRRDERVPQILIRNNVPASCVSGPPINIDFLYGPGRQITQPA
jgi:hypothetical protein